MTFKWAKTSVALGLALVFQITAACSEVTASPDYFPRDDIVEDHFLSSSKLVRSSTARIFGPTTIGLTLTVGKDGDVVGVEKSDTRQSLDARLEAAIAAAYTWRYRPFLRGGEPVVARVNVYIDVVPPEDIPAAKVPFPASNPKTTLIELSRQSDAGPGYSLNIGGNGEITYDGGTNVLVVGKQLSRIEPLAVEQLVKQFSNANFLALRDEYSASGIMDAGSSSIGIRVGPKAKEVHEYVGAWAGMPASVATLQDAVDQAAGVERWTVGNAETVPALRQSGFDFKSESAAEMLISAAGYSNPALAFDLLTAGAPVRLPPHGNDREYTAASAAAARGQLELFKAIVAAGGLRQEDRKQVDVAMRAAAVSGNLALAREVLKLRPRFGSGQDNSTVLHDVARAAPCKLSQKVCDYPAMVKLLVQQGANPNAVNQSGWLAINGDTKDPEVARALLAAGINPNSAASGQPLLFDIPYEDVALELVAAGADLAARGHEGDINVVIPRRRWNRIKKLVQENPPNVRAAAAALIANTPR